MPFDHLSKLLKRYVGCIVLQIALDIIKYRSINKRRVVRKILVNYMKFVAVYDPVRNH